MFTHLLMESGFGASFELGRTPKPAGPLPRQRPQPGARGRALSATRPTGAADGHRAPSIADSHPLAPGRRMRRRPGCVGVSKARVAGEKQSSGQGKERRAEVLISHRIQLPSPPGSRPSGPVGEERETELKTRGNWELSKDRTQTVFVIALGLVFLFRFGVCTTSISHPHAPHLSLSMLWGCTAAASCPVSQAEAARSGGSLPPTPPPPRACCRGTCNICMNEMKSICI